MLGVLHTESSAAVYVMSFSWGKMATFSHLLATFDHLLQFPLTIFKESL